jgi:hypothetical protein
VASSAVLNWVYTEHRGMIHVCCGEKISLFEDILVPGLATENSKHCYTAVSLANYQNACHTYDVGYTLTRKLKGLTILVTRIYYLMVVSELSDASSTHEMLMTSLAWAKHCGRIYIVRPKRRVQAGRGSSILEQGGAIPRDRCATPRPQAHRGGEPGPASDPAARPRRRQEKRSGPQEAKASTST